MLAQQVFTNLGNTFLALKAQCFNLKPLKLTVLWCINQKIVDFLEGLNNRYNKFIFCPLCTFIMLDKISNTYLKKCSNRQTQPLSPF